VAGHGLTVPGKRRAIGGKFNFVRG
jgi:hypothetical protein